MNPLPPASTESPAGADRRETIVLLAYENLAAALRASELIGSLVRQISADDRALLRPWKFSSLERPDQSARAAASALGADLIVIAGSGTNHELPAFVETWLEKSLGRPRRLPTAVAALFSDPDLPDCPDSPRLQTVQRLADAAGCPFFAPGLPENALYVA